MREYLRTIRNFLGTGLIFSLFFYAEKAQATDLFVKAAEGRFFDDETKMVLLILFRFLLVLLLLIAGMFGAKSGYDWLYWENNAKKAKENKRKLTNALLFVCFLFFLLVMFRVFVPDYSTLIWPY